MTEYSTEQEQFWAGEFGDEYYRRNSGDRLLASNLSLFARALRHARGVNACIEFGANIGMNLRALRLLYPDQEQHAVEINASAAEALRRLVPAPHVYGESILEFEPNRLWDLVLVKGVLIHVNPDALARVYDTLVASTSRYLLIAEYYDPNPTCIPYRGHPNRLFKRDFAGELMTRHPEMQLVDYGFVYHGDATFPLDDISWFLMQKQKTSL